MTEPSIRITVDGRRALTVAQAADKYGIEPSSMRAALTRAGIATQPAAKLDGRTPLYLAAVVDKVMSARPGRGRAPRRDQKAGT